MPKTFLLDTNILMRSPYAFNVFEEHNVIICDKTLEELDDLKIRPGDAGYSAREAIRALNDLREQGSLYDGVTLQGGGTLRIVRGVRYPVESTTVLSEEKPDDVIIRAANENKAILVTNDISMALKAETIGVKTESFKNEIVSDTYIHYTGRGIVYTTPEGITELYNNKQIAVSMLTDENGEPAEIKNNQFLCVTNITNLSNTALAVCNGAYATLLKHEHVKPFNVKPRNMGQRFAVEALMRPAEEVPLVFLKGPAGTAKTFLALACGLEQVINQRIYKRMYIYRPNIKFDDDIGFLKGDEMDKIMPLIRPCLDNLEALVVPKNATPAESLKVVQDLFDTGTIKAEALAYLRGRSISNSYIIIDEAQNTTPNQMLGIITRAGVGSKIVILGDPEQIDNERVNKRSNGLVVAAEKMASSKYCMQLSFEQDECVRSDLALEASRLIK